MTSQRDNYRSKRLPRCIALNEGGTPRAGERCLHNVHDTFHELCHLHADYLGIHNRINTIYGNFVQSPEGYNNG